MRARTQDGSGFTGFTVDSSLLQDTPLVPSLSDVLNLFFRYLFHISDPPTPVNGKLSVSRLKCWGGGYFRWKILYSSAFF